MVQENEFRQSQDEVGSSAQQEDPLAELARIVSGGDVLNSQQQPPQQPVQQSQGSQGLEDALYADFNAAQAPGNEIAPPPAWEPVYDDAQYQDQAYLDDPAGVFAEPQYDQPVEYAPQYAPQHAEAFPNLNPSAEQVTERQMFTTPAEDTSFAQAASAQHVPQPTPQSDEFAEFGQEFQAELDAQFDAAITQPTMSHTPASHPASHQASTPANMSATMPAATAQENASFPPAPAEDDLGAFPPAMDPYSEAPNPAYAEANFDGIDESGALASDDAFFAAQAEPEAQSGGIGKLFGILAATTVVLLGGFAVYSYVTSDTPVNPNEVAVVEAETDPVKVKPEDRGGVDIPNQDKSVYDRVEGEGNNATTSQENLVVGTEQPVSRADAGDSTSKEADRLAEVANNSNNLLEPRRVKTVVVKPNGQIIGELAPTPVQPNSTQTAAPETVANETAQAPDLTPLLDGASRATGSVPLPRNAPAGLQIEVPEPVQTANATTQQVQPVVQAVPTAPVTATQNAPLQLGSAAPEPINQVSAPTPLAQPAAQPVAQPAPQPVAQAVAEPVSAPAQAAPPIVPAGSGGYAVQVSSQRTPEAAQAAYGSIQSQFPSLFGGRDANIRRAEIEGKGVFYRVQVPAGSRANAITLCEMHKASGGSCFITQ